MSPIVSTPTLPIFDSIQSGMGSIILENPYEAAADLKSVPFVPTGSGKPSEPKIHRYYVKSSEILYSSEANGGMSLAERVKACVLCKYKKRVVNLLWKLGGAGVSVVLPAGTVADGGEGEGEGEEIRDPADHEGSVASGEGVTVLPGFSNNPITKDEFERELEVVPCLSLSMHIEMMGGASGAGFGCGGDSGREARKELAELLAKIESEGAGVEGDGAQVEGTGHKYGAAEAEEMVLINVCNNLDGEGNGYLETVEGGDGGEPAILHCGVQFNAV